MEHLKNVLHEQWLAPTQGQSRTYASNHKTNLIAFDLEKQTQALLQVGTPGIDITNTIIYIYIYIYICILCLRTPVYLLCLTSVMYRESVFLLSLSYGGV
jgi:hypothetical protein